MVHRGAVTFKVLEGKHRFVTLHEMEIARPAPFAFPSIEAVGSALPANYLGQEVLTAALAELWREAGLGAQRCEKIQKALGIEGRYLSLPLEEYRKLNTFTARNDAWLRIAPELAEAAVRQALKRAELDAAEVDHLLFVTVTGVATPSVDARLVNRLGMRRDVRRTPIFGLGCAAGAGALGRATDYLLAYPRAHVVIVAVELCSLTLQHQDLSTANMIASGLFGDGAAAIVMSGAALGGGGPQVVASRSLLYRDTERVLGWDLVETGFKIVLSAQLPRLIRNSLRDEADSFLGEHGLGISDIGRWIVHPGGPKVLDAVEEALGLEPAALSNSRGLLQRTGNLSSASIMFLLEDVIYGGERAWPEWWMVLAMGPGFGVEMALIRWSEQ
jgi:alkylresorcinol/alkylpyrone synthase